MTRSKPQWLKDYYAAKGEGETPFRSHFTQSTLSIETDPVPLLLADKGFNSHAVNDGTHVSPYDEGALLVGTDGLMVRLVQGIDERSFKAVLNRSLHATTGISPNAKLEEGDWEEMMKGGLQGALESQSVVFEVHGASRALTHQLVRTRKAAFGQQSQRATWFGIKPNVRIPASIFRNEKARQAFRQSVLVAWEAYETACLEGISYQDARFILPEGVVNYITCTYPLREFLNVYAYRACSGFMWEMVEAMRQMGAALLLQSPWLEPYVKISCEKGPDCISCGGTGKFSYSNPTPVSGTWVDGITPGSDCPVCDGKGGLTRKCHFQGWENVENFCDKPQARQDNRVFLPKPSLRIGA